ncbi:MAG: alkaline phosphatase [Acidobacteria bacterium]|nr:alkaline phosphatase [Acidobacteriota bacterium]
MTRIRLAPVSIIALALLTVAAGTRAWSANPPTQRAKNVVLFLGDGTGLATWHAASVRATGDPQGLYVHRMPHFGLSDTSAASSWVADSAAGMTAIVTGQKTNNGVLSQGPEGKRGSADGRTLKTILEYAEEHGLSTGLVTNSGVTDATPAACYAHSNERDEWGKTFAQLLDPAFGDGVDVLIGTGYERLRKGCREIGLDIPSRLEKAGYLYVQDPALLATIPQDATRVVGIFEVAHQADFDLTAAVNVATRILSRNPKGFFLMVESNNHFSEADKSIEGAIRMDQIVHETADAFKETPTLILVTADHSYDLRMPRSKGRTKDIFESIEIGGSHTAEQVPVFAQGPAAEGISGFVRNTDLLHVMMKAYGWE